MVLPKLDIVNINRLAQTLSLPMVNTKYYFISSTNMYKHLNLYADACKE